MATDAPSPSYEKTANLMEWDSLSEEDQMKHQQELIDYLNKPDTLEEFSEACKKIGQTAVAIDDDFRAVKNGFADIVKKHGRDFPDVGNVFVSRWDRLKALWNGETGILWSSRELAANTAAMLTRYDLTLQLVQEIATKGDLEDAKEELKRYIEMHPPRVSNEVADGFKNLANDMKDFSKSFENYVKEQKQKLSEEARGYLYKIRDLQNEITDLDGKIRDAALLLGCAWPLGLLAAIPAASLIANVIKRRKVQSDLDIVKAKLAGVAKKLEILAAMQADFEHLKPNIDDICVKLGIFAKVWAFTIEQSIEVEDGLKQGLGMATRKGFRLRLELLRAQVKPLQEGMRQYSTQITASKTSSNVE